MKRFGKAQSVAKPDVKLIKEKTKQFLNDRKNANNLLEILAIVESEENEVLLACIHSFHKIYTSLLSSNEMSSDQAAAGAESKLKYWYVERYDEARAKLLDLLLHSNENVKELSLCTLMKFIQSEGQTPLTKMAKKNVWFPTSFFQKVIGTVINSEIDATSLITRFQEFLEYDDVRYNTMKQINYLIVDQKDKEMTEVFLGNVFAILKNLSMPTTVPEGDKLTNFMTHVPDTAGLKISTLKEHKKLFSTVWLEFLKLKLPVSVYKKALVILHDKVMPNMTNPRLLADFLTVSYDRGGVISVLALNGVFILVSEYNLDYPDFYQKLYALFEPAVLHVKYSARFFYLTDLFLSSTHLPAYLVAAFIKRLARLALTAPPSGLVVLLPFIQNLIRRHPNCEILMHSPDAPTDVTSDPYLADETDPSKCNAMKSSLWEVKTLQDHFHHAISEGAKVFNKNLAPKESELGDFLETSIDDMIHTEKKKKMKTVSMTFDEPSGMFTHAEDKLGQFWSLKDT